MNKLAIVIPAFKIDFLIKTLASIAMQTDKRFVVYIGDDASPDDLKGVIDEFAGEFAVVYKRFEQNMGGSDLVGHWERCVDLVNDEEWIWMFSDDDVMEATCVEAFYSCLSEKGEYADIFHFNQKTIDEHGDQIWPFQPFPKRLAVTDFFFKRINHQIHSTGVEYIFRKAAWERLGKFKKFDLAWFSDDATWIKLAADNGIHTIPGALVYWRYSKRNISSVLGDQDIVRRKVDASLAYMTWIGTFFRENRIADLTSAVDKVKYLLSVPLNSTVLTWSEKKRYVQYISDYFGLTKRDTLSVFCYFVFFVIKNAIRKMLEKVGLTVKTE